MELMMKLLFHENLSKNIKFSAKTLALLTLQTIEQ